MGDATSSAALDAASLGNSQMHPVPDRPDFPLVDIHVHLGASDSGELYYPHLTGDEYLTLMARSGVVAAWAFPPLRNDGYREANRQLRHWCDGTGGRIAPFARLSGRRLPPARGELWLLRRKLKAAVVPPRPALDAVADLAGFAGVKLLPLLDGLPSKRMLRAVADAGLPVLTHAGERTEPAWLARHLLPVLPGPIILAHLGAFPCTRRLLEDAVALAAKDPRVYLDTSGVWITGFLRYAAERVPEKLLFGSDAPLAHPLVAWRHVASSLGDSGLLRQIGRLNVVTMLEAHRVSHTLGVDCVADLATPNVATPDVATPDWAAPSTASSQ